MIRRDFLKSSLGLVASSIVGNKVFAEDYSIKKDEYAPHYVYNPFAEQRVQQIEQSEQSSYTIRNDILPEMNQDFWSMPRKINLLRLTTGEKAELIYYQNGGLVRDAYYKACYLLRDTHQNVATTIDPKLLDLICATQAWLVFYGYNTPIHINSGYRTLKTNSNLEGAAKNSMHLYGKAIDFSVPNLSVFHIAQIAQKFKAGGIGLYPTKNFIHLDTGGVRTWLKK